MLIEWHHLKKRFMQNVMLYIQNSVYPAHTETSWPSIPPLSIPFIPFGAAEAGVYPTWHWARGRLQPEPATIWSQGHIETDNHSRSHSYLRAIDKCLNQQTHRKAQTDTGIKPATLLLRDLKRRHVWTESKKCTEKSCFTKTTLLHVDMAWNCCFMNPDFISVWLANTFYIHITKLFPNRRLDCKNNRQM